MGGSTPGILAVVQEGVRQKGKIGVPWAGSSYGRGYPREFRGMEVENQIL